MEEKKEYGSKRYGLRIPQELDNKLKEYLDKIKHKENAQDIMRKALEQFLKDK